MYHCVLELNYYQEFIFLPMQVIIPASWIFALIMEMPGFLSLDFDKTLSSCTLAFTKEWMGKAYSVVWFLVFGGLPVPLMAVLYSTVVYNLWFKRNDQNTLTYQQKVIRRLRSCFMKEKTFYIFS